MAENKRAGRMSKKQKEFMIARLETDKFLLVAHDKMKPYDIPKHNYAWTKLAEDLNSIAGCKKTLAKWKEALNELKVNTRRRARLLHQEAVGTGGGPKREKELTEIEQRLLALLSKVTITGAPDIPEAGLSTQDVQQQILVTPMQNNEIFELDFNEVEVQINEMEVIEATADQPVVENLLVEESPSVSKTPRKKKTFNGDFSDVARNHEMCLKHLSASNEALAGACRQLAQALLQKNRLKRCNSAVFNLRFN